MGFSASAIAPWLSTLMTLGAYFDIPRSLRRFWSQMASLVACVRAAYSASAVDSAIVDCFLACQEIGDPASMKMYPEIDFLSSLDAQSASEYPWIPSAVPLLCSYVR